MSGLTTEGEDTLFNAQYNDTLIAVGQFEEAGAQDVVNWNEEPLTDEVCTVEESVDEEVPAHLARILNKDLSGAKHSYKYVQDSPSTGSIIYKNDIRRVYSIFGIGGTGMDTSHLAPGSEERRSVELMNLVCNFMVQGCDYLLMDSYTHVLNVSRPCWYAQLFLLYLANHVASKEKEIDYDTMRQMVAHFYKEVFPRFHCKGKFRDMQSTSYRDPKSLHRLDGLEVKKVDTLIKTVLKPFLPALAKMNSPSEYVQRVVVEPSLAGFGLNRTELNFSFHNKIIKYIILNRIVESLHWYFKDLGFRPRFVIRGNASDPWFAIDIERSIYLGRSE